MIYMYVVLKASLRDEKVEIFISHPTALHFYDAHFSGEIKWNHRKYCDFPLCQKED